MKFSIAVIAACAALFQATSAYQAWVAPGSGDSRGPCPGLNTLANHGYLPHNGQAITRDDFVTALTEVYNLDSGLAGSLADGALTNLGHNDTNGDLVVNLSDLDAHNVLEHDASITRYDAGDSVGDNHTPQPQLIKDFKSWSSDGTVMTWCDVAKAKNFRTANETASDPNFSLTIKQKAIALGEASLILNIFGNGKNVSLTNIDSFFGEEAIPSGWNPPAQAYTETDAAEGVAEMEAYILDPFCQA